MILDQQRKIFHESWYRLSGSRIALRASVRVRRQTYRGVLWYVLFEPYTNKYYRLPQGAYEFVSRLTTKKTVGEIWSEVLNSGAEDVPGQGEVIEMLAQLYQANMLLYEGVEDGTKLFERDKKNTQKKVKSTLLNIFFLRIPVFDPEPFLRRFRWVASFFLSKFFWVLWLVAIGVAAKFGIENFDALKDQTQGFLAPANIGWVYVCTVLVKALHELGHSFAVKKYGGEVHTIGIMFMMLVPLPYMDATASWAFRKKRHRVLVGAAGMLTEFFIASVALVLWANVGGGMVKSLAYNVLVMTSVSTVLFNINPLMRFDGYYMLVDLLDMPNLQQHSVMHLKYLLERYVFRKQDAQKVAESWSEAVIYTVYGFSSAIYRFFLFAGFIVAISQHYLILSVIMGVMLILSMIIMPVGKFLKYVFSSPGLLRVRLRAVSVSVSFFVIVASLLFYVPAPDTFTAPGVLETKSSENTIVATSGQVMRICHRPGDRVTQGDTLLVLQNDELEFLLEQKRAEITEATQQYYKALNETPENMYPLEKRLEVLRQELQELQLKKDRLVMLANMDGIWDAPGIDDYHGRWVKKGDSLGMLLDTASFDFLAVVSQEDVSRLFMGKPKQISVRLKGDAFSEITVDSASAIPASLDKLPSAALSWQGGGEIETHMGKDASEETSEPIYLVRASLRVGGSGVAAMRGRSGKIRFYLGDTPLALQGIRKVKQALQKYYRM